MVIYTGTNKKSNDLGCCSENAPIEKYVITFHLKRNLKQKQQYSVFNIIRNIRSYRGAQ